MLGKGSSRKERVLMLKKMSEAVVVWNNIAKKLETLPERIAKALRMHNGRLRK